jgi:RNA polymerase sigma-70 factor (ECF subfamily)
LEILETDRILVNECVLGKRDAQFDLYKKYNQAMYNICLRMLSDQSDAEDILQNSFLDVFSKISMFKFESTPGAWIKRIVVNNCINHLRKRKIELISLDEKVILVEDNHEDSIDLNVNAIYEAISQLPDGYRVVFSLYVLEGYDHGEISEILQISESTSKSQYSRARAKIYEILKSSGNINNIYN